MRIALLGGSLRDGSLSLQVLRVCASLTERFGARPTLLSAPQLVLPPYLPDAVPDRAAPTPANRLLSLLRQADGVIIATPTYHGGMSGLLKNALDHVENLASDTPAYLEGRAVGAVAVGWSEHGAATAVADLRTNIMSLRGWVTPMAVTVNALCPSIVDKGVRADGQVMRRLEIMVGQVVDFARQSSAGSLPASA